MLYVSYAQLAKDVYAWSQQLPRDIDAFVGVARSGVVPAMMLALHRNVRAGVVENGLLVFNGGYRDQHKKIKRVMVIDDSILSGKSIKQAQRELREVKDVDIIYGAVYIQPGMERNWFHYRIIPTPRIFEWNWLHHYWLGYACMDIDGVLCRDPSREENDDGLRYRKFLHTATPRHLPRVEVDTLCTSRLEKYRMDTEKWLKRHGVRYKQLIMHPAKTAVERRKMGDHAERKAQVYRDKKYKLFVESDERQAKIIYAKTGKPVLCTDTWSFHP